MGGRHNERAAGSGMSLVARPTDPEAGAGLPDCKTGQTRAHMRTGEVDDEMAGRSDAEAERGERVQRWAKLGIDQGQLGMHRHPRS